MAGQDYLHRSAALFSAVFPVVWLGLLLIYAARRRVTAEAILTAFTMGFLSALTVGISFLTVAAVTAGSDVISLKGVFATSFLAAALPEEAAKLAVILTIVYRHEDVISPLDYILTAGWVGLGFAGLENIFYVFGEFADRDGKWLSLAIARAATAVPSHTMSGVLMGILLASSLEERAHKARWMIASFLIPFFLHGLYDVCVVSLREQANGLPFSAEPWHLALGLGVVMTFEAWLAFALVRYGRSRWHETLAPPLRSGQSRWIEYSFRMLLILTMLIAIGLIGLGIFGVWKRHNISAFAGAGIAWLGIAYTTRLLCLTAKDHPSDLTVSPQVPISKDLASG